MSVMDAFYINVELQAHKKSEKVIYRIYIALGSAAWDESTAKQGTSGGIIV